MCFTLQKPDDIRVAMVMDTINNDVVAKTVLIEVRLRVEALEAVIVNFESGGIKEYDEMVNILKNMGAYIHALKKLNLDLKNITIHPTSPFIEDPSILELKSLLCYVKYAFLGDDNTLPIIISIDLIVSYIKILNRCY